MMGGPFQIIPAVHFHSQVLTIIHGACFDEGWVDLDISRFLSTPGAEALIAIESDVVQAPHHTPAGFILYRCSADECEVITLCVLSEARRRGAARQLLSALGDVLIKKGVVTIFLEVEEKNEAAIRLYEKDGYVQIGRRKEYYRTKTGPSDALIFHRKLRSVG